ncbi:UDP-4-amino-4,6-dideoxy-N-acetyl-beta-L-altrosamine transaminase [Alphaproteobacteria bacterium]|nr:UDP-4-amino-4,6-dideoxy-N-acetyl-beta-L-altrosamine transaminase [Alphaproteobacteria bacterium]
MSRTLIIGGSGLLSINWAISRRKVEEVHIASRNCEIALKNVVVHTVDGTNLSDVKSLIAKIRPTVVINCAGYTDVDGCEINRDHSFQSNVMVAANLAQATSEADIAFVHISTDHLFDGALPNADEKARPMPQNVYAKDKALAEKKVLFANEKSLVLRTTFFGWAPAPRRSFSDRIIDSLETDRQIQMFDDVFFTPVYAGTLVEYAHLLVKKNQHGTFNICSSDRISKYEFSKLLACEAGLDEEVIQPIQAKRRKGKTKRPFDLSLNNSKLCKKLGIDCISIDNEIGKLFDAQEARKEISRATKIIPYGKHFVDEDDINAVAKIMRGNWLTQGPTIAKLEQKIAEYTGANYAVAVSSATAGLHLAYHALGVSPGRDVLTTPITFVSTANAAHFCQASAHFADINPETVNLSVEEVRKSISNNSNIHLVAPVIFGGATEDVVEVATLAKNHNKFVVEDAAHGLGAQYTCGAMVGSCKYSDCTVFSLHPVKSIAAGEGGVITTNDKSIYQSLLRLRSHGINKQGDRYLNHELALTNGKPNVWYYEMSELGFHYRITDLQSSLAISQLDKIDEFIHRRREIAFKYVEAFQSIGWIKRAQNICIENSSNHLFIVNIDFDRVNTSRNELMLALRERGIITQVHYIPVVSQPFYSNLGHDPSKYPASQNYYSTALSLPIYYSLDDEDVSYVIDTIKSILHAAERPHC